MELENDDDDDENYEEACDHDGVEEGEIPVSVCYVYTAQPSNQFLKFQTEAVDQSVETQQAAPTSTNPTQLIKKILPGHGPADGVTRQTLKSIRIHRSAVRIAAESDAKKLNTD